MEATSPPPISVHPEHDSHVNILLIEDNPEDRFLIEDMLQSGHNLKVNFILADCMADGINRLTSGGVDLVLLDLSLPPEYRGIETFRKIYPFVSSLPVVVLTGYSDEELQAQVLGEGAQDYLIKGEITPEILERSLRYALWRSRSEEKREQLQQRINERTIELETANNRLKLEIQERERIQAMLEGQNQTLEKVARSASLSEILGTLATTVEVQLDQVLCSILLLDSQEQCLRIGCQSGIPDAYNKIIDGISLVPPMGPCLQAVTINQSIIIEDIASDSRFPEFRKLSLPFGFRACWSTPIRSSSGNVLGTICLYYKKPRGPTETEEQIIRSAEKQAGVAIERKQVEEALRTSEERLKLALEGTSDGLWDWNIKTGEVYFSPRWMTMLGYEPFELEGHVRSWEKLVHPEDKDEVMRVLTAHLEGKTPVYETEHRVRTKTGEWKWILDRGKVLSRDQDGNPLRAAGLHSDITVRKEMEKALRESEEKFRKSFEESPMGMALAGQDYRLQKVNRTFCSMLGYTQEELTSKTFVDITHPDDIEKGVQFAKKLASGEIPTFTIEKRYLKKNQEVIWANLTVSIIRDEAGNPLYSLARIEDITNRKEAERELEQYRNHLENLVGQRTEELTQANHKLKDEVEHRTTVEEKLKSSQQMLQLVLNTTPIRIFWKDLDLNFLGCNTHVAKDGGLKSPDDIIGKNDFQFSWREQAERYRADDRQVIESGIPKLNYEELQTRPDGSKFWLKTSKIPLRDAHGNIVGILGCYEDITDRKRALEDLRQREYDLAQAQEIAHLGNWTYDVETKELRWSDETYRIFGLTPQEIIVTYESFIDRIHPEDRILVNQANLGSFFKKQPYDIEHRIIRPDGEVRIVHEQSKIYYDEKGFPKKIAGTIHDITERKRTEAELKKSKDRLMHAEKLSTAGKLLATIAHEINNPIFGIRNVLGKLRQKVPMQEKYNKFNDLAIKECDRVTDLIKKLQDFHRPSPDKKIQVNLNQTIDDMVWLIQRQLDLKKITLKKQYEKKLPSIFVVEDQIKQVILNLLQNAEESILEDNGVIRIQTKFDRSGVHFVIQDTGCGISSKNLKNIFDPFYSTKAEVKGTGLGLSISYSIVQFHNGLITVDSKPGVGTTFKVTLPMNPESV